jgi:hypothetical protein
MTTTNLEPADTNELAELLQFIRDWLSTDYHQLDRSFTAFVGNPCYDLRQLRADLDRFTFLLGANDGETLFNHEP